MKTKYEVQWMKLNIQLNISIDSHLNHSHLHHSHLHLEGIRIQIENI